MAVTPPLYINAVEYNAEAERRGLSGLVAQSAPGVARSGILGPAPDVSLNGSIVQVGPCHAVISSAKGGYLTGVDSVTNAGTVGVPDQTNGRLDRVVLEVLDPDNGSAGTGRLARLRVISGEAKAIPGLPPLPPLALHIGQVLVPKVNGGNPVLTVDCQFTAAAGAPVPVRTLAERAAITPRVGQLVLRLDRNGVIESGTGTGWRDSGVNIRNGLEQARTNAQGYCTVPYSQGPFPNGTANAVANPVEPPLGMTSLQYAGGNAGSANFRVFASTGEPILNTTVGFSYIAVGY